MEALLMRIEGTNGQIELFEDKLIIKRAGALAKMTQGFFKGDKTIYLNNISGIQVKPGTALTNGYIQFTLAGGYEKTKGINEATHDENSIFFKKKENDNIISLRDKIETLRSITNSQNSFNTASVADELKKFKELLDLGAITNDEYEIAKKKALG